MLYVPCVNKMWRIIHVWAIPTYCAAHFRILLRPSREHECTLHTIHTTSKIERAKHKKYTEEPVGKWKNGSNNMRSVHDGWSCECMCVCVWVGVRQLVSSSCTKCDFRCIHCTLLVSLRGTRIWKSVYKWRGKRAPGVHCAHTLESHGTWYSKDHWFHFHYDVTGKARVSVWLWRRQSRRQRRRRCARWRQWMCAAATAATAHRSWDDLWTKMGHCVFDISVLYPLGYCYVGLYHFPRSTAIFQFSFQFRSTNPPAVLRISLELKYLLFLYIWYTYFPLGYLARQMVPGPCHSLPIVCRNHSACECVVSFADCKYSKLVAFSCKAQD